MVVAVAVITRPRYLGVTTQVPLRPSQLRGRPGQPLDIRTASFLDRIRTVKQQHKHNNNNRRRRRMGQVGVVPTTVIMDSTLRIR